MSRKLLPWNGRNDLVAKGTKLAELSDGPIVERLQSVDLVLDEI